MSNLNLLRTCKQIYREANLLAFTATTFDLRLSRSDVDLRTSRLNDNERSSITSVSRIIGSIYDLETFTALRQHQIQPTQVILVAYARMRPWFDITFWRRFTLCQTTTQSIMSAVVYPNPQLRELVIRKDMRHFECPEIEIWRFTDADQQLQEHRLELQIWKKSADDVEDTRLNEKARDELGLSLVEISFKVKGELSRRVFTTRWDIFNVDVTVRQSEL